MNNLMNGICGECCYVAFLDILGFKDLLLHESSAAEVAQIFINIKNLRKSCLERHNYDKEYDKALDDTLIRIISDSVIVATPTRYLDSLSIVSEICMVMQEELLKNNHILIRGAITKGEVFYDDEITFGTGIVKAYIKEEQAVYPRITIAKELVDEYVDRVGTSRITYITDYLLKDDDEIFFIWYFHDNSDVKEWIKEQLSKEQIYGRVREKYLWIDRWINMSEELLCQRCVEQYYKELFTFEEE